MTETCGDNHLVLVVSVARLCTEARQAAWTRKPSTLHLCRPSVKLQHASSSNASFQYIRTIILSFGKVA